MGLKFEYGLLRVVLQYQIIFLWCISSMLLNTVHVLILQTQMFMRSQILYMLKPDSQIRFWSKLLGFQANTHNSMIYLGIENIPTLSNVSSSKDSGYPINCRSVLFNSQWHRNIGVQFTGNVITQLSYRLLSLLLESCIASISLALVNLEA